MGKHTNRENNMKIPLSTFIDHQIEGTQHSELICEFAVLLTYNGLINVKEYSGLNWLSPIELQASPLRLITEHLQVYKKPLSL